MARGVTSVGLIALGLSACAPAEPNESQVQPQLAPDPAYVANFPGCQWGEVISAGVSVWSFACPNDRIVADPALPGFVREATTPDGVVRAPVIVLFDKAETDPLNAVLPAVRAASPGSATATCAFEERTDMVGFYRFMPTGEARRAYDALIAPDAPETPDADYMPCGAWGPSEAGERVITVVRGGEDKVAAINLGSEITLFDLETLKRTK